MMKQSIIDAMKAEGYTFGGTTGGRIFFLRKGSPFDEGLLCKTWGEVRAFYDKASARYALPDLAEIDIDLWVNGMSHLADRHGGEIDGYTDGECPAEYEAEFTEYAETHGILFDGFGRIAKEGADA